MAVLAVAGGAVGYWCSRGRKARWAAGYVVSLLFLLIIGAARRFPSLESRPPFAWIMAGRFEFALLAPVFAMLVMTLLSRLPRKNERILLGVLMVALISTSSVLPFLLPALNYEYLAGLTTIVDPNGVCIQSNGYTCGPAAAVTALRGDGDSRLRRQAGDCRPLPRVWPARRPTACVLPLPANTASIAGLRRSGLSTS